jgi:hypothetical protein
MGPVPREGRRGLVHFSAAQKEPIPNAVSQAWCWEGSLRDVPSAETTERNTVEESNKDSLRRDRWLCRTVRHLRERFARQGRVVYGQALRGAAYSVGSGAVSVIVLWFEARR